MGRRIKKMPIALDINMCVTHINYNMKKEKTNEIFKRI